MTKTNKIIGVVVAALLLILTFTNPSEQDHRDAVMTKITEKVKENQPENEWEEAGQNLGLMFLQGMIGNIVTRNNYVLFSTTKLSYQGETKVIGYGVLGKVYIQEVPEQQ